MGPRKVCSTTRHHLGLDRLWWFRCSSCRRKPTRPRVWRMSLATDWGRLMTRRGRSISIPMIGLRSWSCSANWHCETQLKPARGHVQAHRVDNHRTAATTTTRISKRYLQTKFGDTRMTTVHAEGGYHSRVNVSAPEMPMLGQRQRTEVGGQVFISRGP